MHCRADQAGAADRACDGRREHDIGAALLQCGMPDTGGGDGTLDVVFQSRYVRSRLGQILTACIRH
ncbi:hypothetical protein AU476_39350 [Cupriavidus sp. UYMSc13B]|nr:hypothetical protein AU476_39350 [Cupriavidus sp. UYMSc13B]